MKKQWIIVLASFFLLPHAYGQAIKNRPDPGMEPPVIDTSPDEKYLIRNLDYGMTIGIERTPGGRIWACWTGGEDGPKAFFVLTYSDDGGLNWLDTQVVIDPHDESLGEERRTIVGCLWTDPNGKLWLFFDQSMARFDGRAGAWYTVCENPDGARPEWSQPRYIAPGASLNKPIVTTRGEWMLPVSLWGRGRILGDTYKESHHELDSMRRANVYVSVDQGRTWTFRGGVEIPEARFDEPNVLELKDGRIMMTARSRALKIYRSFSGDGGRTWTSPEIYVDEHADARHFIQRLASGNIVMVRHNATTRKNLTAYLSDDEGETWKGGLLLDERSGVSYPDGFESKDGYIFVSYDRKRSSLGEILIASFTEEDILAGEIVSRKGYLKQLISRPGRIDERLAREAAEKEMKKKP